MELDQGTREPGLAPPLAESWARGQSSSTPGVGHTRSNGAPCRPAEVGDRKLRASSAPTRGVLTGFAEREGAAMASPGVGVSAAGSANETPEIPDNVGDWLRGVYRFATDRNDFRRNLILNLGLFAAGVWLARNLSDIDLMAPQPGV